MLRVLPPMGAPACDGNGRTQHQIDSETCRYFQFNNTVKNTPDSSMTDCVVEIKLWYVASCGVR